MEEIKIVLDTDVIISALLSERGASYKLINDAKVKMIISKAIAAEVTDVAAREDITKSAVRAILAKLKLTQLFLSKEKLLEKYSNYVFDDEDSHVIACAHISKSDFLLTHNIRHYHVLKIKNDLGIKVFRPGDFLQYLRSLL